MAHTPEDQAKLDSMTDKQKMKETSFERMAQKKSIIRCYDDWYVTINEMPHSEYKDNFIAWCH